MESILTKNQKKTVGPRYFHEGGIEYRIITQVRYDDECGNGHNTFSITGEIHRKNKHGQWEGDSFGCLHNEISRYFPELAHLIKWHLMGSDGPLYYLQNTLYLASDRDCWGGRKNDPRAMKYFVRTNQGGLLVSWPEYAEGKLYRGGPNVQEYDSEADAQAVADAHGNATVVAWATMRHEGKARELDLARSCAIWPDATDDELVAPGLKDRLIARLPSLIADFRQDIEALGFVF